MKRWWLDPASIRDVAVIAADTVGQLLGAAAIACVYWLVGDTDPNEDEA